MTPRFRRRRSCGFGPAAPPATRIPDAPMNTPSPRPASDPASGARSSLLASAAPVLYRVVVPLWLAAGAAVKLWERNPQLLPKPVTDVTDLLLTRGFGIPREQYLDPAMRAMVAVELAIALAMMFGPARFARAAGVAVLGLFCVILGVLLASGAASCGCFGASGPSPSVMLAIDGALLVALVVMPLGAQRGTVTEQARRFGSLLAVSLIFGAVVAFAVPARGAVSLDPETVAGAGDVPSAPDAPKVTDATDATGPRPWPARPAAAQPWYAPEFPAWKGTRVDSHELMLLVRPMPVNLNAGRHHVVLMREDCDHCHELLMLYFGADLPAPTLAIAVPDATGERLENPCTACTSAVFPGGITYVFATPVLLTVQDGVVVGVCTDSTDADAVRATIDAR